MSFMLHVSNQNRHPFSQCECFSQVEHFEKPWFIAFKFLKLKKNLMSFLHFEIKPGNIKFNVNMKQKKFKSNNEIKCM